MTVTLTHLDELIATIKDTPSLDVVWVALDKQMQRLGFPLFSYQLLWPKLQTDQHLVISNYPEDWIKYYRENRYWEIDPVLMSCKQAHGFFFWRQAVAQMALEPEQRDFMAEAAKIGIHDFAMTLPVFGPGMVRAMFSLIAPEAKPTEKLFLERHRHELHLIATYVHEQVVRLCLSAPQVSRKITLSPRERDCLSWAAEGKTAWEVAQILGITEYTVRDYWRHAQKKLGVHDKTHAVVQALLQGHIEL